MGGMSDRQNKSKSNTFAPCEAIPGILLLCGFNHRPALIAEIHRLPLCPSVFHRPVIPAFIVRIKIKILINNDKIPPKRTVQTKRLLR